MTEIETGGIDIDHLLIQKIDLGTDLNLALLLKGMHL